MVLVKSSLIALYVALTIGMASSLGHSKTPEVILATTTSTQDSGLLDVLLPLFQRKTGIFVKTVAVGSGQALALGERGEADVLLVHSPKDEISFMERGLGVRRRPVMYNDFVLLGPREDPAGLKNAKTLEEALRKIARGFLFISRGDLSGTHVLEMELWKATGVSPQGARWYHETGQGMGQTLLFASEKRAYTLSDRGTYLSLISTLSMEIFFEGDQRLKNFYHVIEVNGSRFKRVNSEGARLFADFLVSKEAQEVIGKYGTERFGQPLFFPALKGEK